MGKLKLIGKGSRCENGVCFPRVWSFHSLCEPRGGKSEVRHQTSALPDSVVSWLFIREVGNDILSLQCSLIERRGRFFLPSPILIPGGHLKSSTLHLHNNCMDRIPYRPHVSQHLICILLFRVDKLNG